MSPEQTELFPSYKEPLRLTVAEGFSFLWKYHLGNLPSGATFNANRKALVKTIGHKFIDELTDWDIQTHCDMRRKGLCNKGGAGPQTIKHDIKLVALLINKLSEWKQKRYERDGFKFNSLKMPFYPPTKGVKRPKTTPRKVTISPIDFSKYIEHCHEDLKERLYFLIDLGLSPIDAKELTVSNYDPNLDVIRFVRHKTLKTSATEVVLPVSDRCRKIIIKAIQEKREYILIWKGFESQHRDQYERARWASGINFKLGLDLRKTNLNAVIDKAKGNLGPAQKIAGHVDQSTTRNHYYIEKAKDLKPYIRHVSEKYAGV